MILKRTTLFLLLTLPLLTGCASAAETPVVPPASLPTNTPDEDMYVEEREDLVQQGIIGYGISSEVVIDAMRKTPRHKFVPDGYIKQAYANHPLPIGFGQTISQPYIVALMSQEMDVEPGDTVLEIGTGSGYQAAVLAEMGLEVYSIEIIEPLADQARDRLQDLGYEQVSVRNADGYFGWPEYAPFDGIIVTAAPDHVPKPLIDQLKIGAVMVIPVGPVGGYQELWRITRVAEGEVKLESLGGVRFVPFTRSDGQD
jgi:protein-L-isoaspartate(D-aspartate) O-methyltransferase